MEYNDQNQNHNNNEHQGTSSITVAAEMPADSQEVPMIGIGRRDANSIWRLDEKVKLVQIDGEERGKGRGFMQRVKQRWDAEYPGRDSITKQNLRDNAVRFRDEPEVMKAITIARQGTIQQEGEADYSARLTDVPEGQQGGSGKWMTTTKARLVEIDKEERQGGRGFMKRVKERWDAEFPEYNRMKAQTLRDNAARFRNEPEIEGLILVRERMAREQAVEEIVRDEIINVEEQLRPTDDINIEEVEGEVVREDSVNELEEGDIELEREFVKQLDLLEKTTTTEIETRERLLKVRMTSKVEGSANRILEKHLKNAEEIEVITDAVYAMGKAVAVISNVAKRKPKGNVKGGNRREQKLRKKMKELRQLIARAGNELYRRKKHRKASKKEKANLKLLQAKMGCKGITNQGLLKEKEKWLDGLRYNKVVLETMLKRGKKIRNNAMFAEDEGGFYRKSNQTKTVTGTVPDIEKFVEFWGGIWEKKEITPEQPWMLKIKERLKNKLRNVEDFDVSVEGIESVVKKRKNWTSPGIDGIQNYWWKKLRGVRSAVFKAFQKWKLDLRRIPEWIALGRSALLPKTENLSPVKEYRPITCLNTSYKIYTGMMAKYMKNHATANDMWDEGQMGTTEGVLGTIDQLLIDRCIMDEVREHQRNLAVAYYDYQKAYDRVHHDWMLKVYRWMGIPDEVCRLMEELMKKWKTRLEVWREGEKKTSRWITISTSFLQGDSLSPVGFCLSEVPIGMLLDETRGYMMGMPDNRSVKRTHSLFIDDLKVYQENHDRLKSVNEMIVQASYDTGACYGVAKCAEIVFEHGKMEKGEGLDVLEERMQSLNPDENEVYKFLGCEQAAKVDKGKVLERVIKETGKRMESLTNLELYDKNLVRAVNCRVIPVAGYAMNICKFSKVDLEELDMVVKRKLRKEKMHGRQASDERLYLPRCKGGRGIKSMRDLYKETKVRVACYMAMSRSRWIEVAWQREHNNEYCSIKREAEDAMREVSEEASFACGKIELNGEQLQGTWKDMWKKLKTVLKLRTEERRIEKYQEKKLQSEIYRGQDERCNQWLECNLDSRKTAAVIEVQEQMVETRVRKVLRGEEVESENCRLCSIRRETVHHWLSGCTVLAGSEYVQRHNKALMVFAVEWAKQAGLLDKETMWYKITWQKGTVLENQTKKLMWDFEYRMRKTTSARRPDLTLEDLEKRKIWIIDMACPSESNIEDKLREKRTKYQQLAFEIRERRPGYLVEVIPFVIGCLGGGMKKLEDEMAKLIPEEKRRLKITREMQKTVLMESESIVRKIKSRIVQVE